MRPSQVRTIVGIVFAFLLLFSITIHPAQALTVNVPCSSAALSAAINIANSAAGADTLNLAAGCPYFYTAGDAVNTDSALPRITSPITINGNGAIIARVGGPQFRLLRVENTGNLTLNNVIILGGSSTGSGGAIFNGGSLTVTNSTVSGNNTADFGGGIYSYGTVTVTNSTLSGNSASGSGGGIFNDVGTLTVTDSTLSGNSTSGSGGGIYTYYGHGDGDQQHALGQQRKRQRRRHLQLLRHADGDQQHALR